MTTSSGAGGDRLRGRDSVAINGDMFGGGLGDDVAHGGRGPDDFGGGKGDDVFYGGKGRDSAAPSDGHDTIYFGAGQDYMEMFEDDGQRDLINCGPSKDRIAYLGSRDSHDVLRGCEVVRAYPSD